MLNVKKWISKVTNWIKSPILTALTSSGGTYYQAIDGTADVSFGIGSSHVNHGVWSATQNRWLIYGDASNVYVGGYELDINTNNTTDTWVFVLNGNKIQHRVLPLNQVDKTMIARGAFSAGDITANSYKDISVSFGKTFSSVPTVVCCLSSSSTAGAIGSMTATPHDETTTGCKIRVFNAGSATRSPAIRWIATNI